VARSGPRASRQRLTEVDVNAILLARLRELDHPWEVIVAADTGIAGHQDFDVLSQLKHDVMPAVAAALETETPVLITEAEPLVRYGQLRLLRELSDATRPRFAARPSSRPWRSSGWPRRR
jgi:hypothetical protein